MCEESGSSLIAIRALSSTLVTNKASWQFGSLAPWVRGLVVNENIKHKKCDTL